MACCFRIPEHGSVRLTILLIAAGLLQVFCASENAFAQSAPLNIFENYFVTGDYAVSGWVEHSSTNGFASGTISIPDCTQAQAMGQPCPLPPVPDGADIVAAYLYWGTVEGNQSLFTGQKAFFNGYPIVGTVLGNPNAPASWSAGGCSGSSGGSKTMRTYRADVRPFLPLDLNISSPTFGALLANGSIAAQFADSGSNGNTQPIALGATLVIIYRVLSPAVPLNAIVLYDGSYAPSNQMPTMTQSLAGFYEPAINPNAKLTEIVANGQANKGESVYFGSNPNSLTLLPSLYSSLPPFPGVYGFWDNPTWSVSGLVHGGLIGSMFDTQETTFVMPGSTNGGCVNWGAIIFSTTVQDSDNDGLPDIWEQDQGYTDAISGKNISLPGASPNTKDLFIELDYLTLRDSSGKILHSHLPKQAALDAVGDAFAAQGINLHVDLPTGIYPGDAYVISTGDGGNEIPESSLLCTDGNTLCQFPNQPAVAWKGGFEFVQSSPAQGNFQAGRGQSYRYALFGHSLGEPRSYWGTAGASLAANDLQDFSVYTMPQLVSIVVANNTATVTIKSPSLIAPGIQPAIQPLLLKPGDCAIYSSNPACGDANKDRVTISGSLTPVPFDPGTMPSTFPLNGTYKFFNAASGPPDQNGVITTTFQITTANVSSGTYNFLNEPELGVSYLGPTSSSGHSDFAGGGDLAVTLGLWGADDSSTCQPDPSLPLTLGQGYCNDQVGTVKVQTGTFMHELGHELTLTHGGAYYKNVMNPSVPTYEVNCKPNFLSVMNYLFQIRGFADGGFDYSGQTLQSINETTSLEDGVPGLSESAGLGSDAFGQPAQHLTRWYSAPNLADKKLQDSATAHCDGSPLTISIVSGMARPEPAAVRVDGALVAGGTFSAPLDWNNDLASPDAIFAPGEDLNHNGIIGDAPFSGFDDWASLNLQQINARSSSFGFSEGGGLQRSGGGGLQRSGGGGVDNDGGGLQRSGGGGLQRSGGGGLQRSGGGGLEQDTETANSSVDPPLDLSCKQSLTTSKGTVVPACTSGTGSFLEKGKNVPLTWTPPDFGQIRSYFIWRAEGSFASQQQILANFNSFSKIGTVSGTPPSSSFIDSTGLKTNTTYTYFISDANKFKAQSGVSTPIVVVVKF